MSERDGPRADCLPVPDPLPEDKSELVLAIRARTPARIFSGRAGPAYRTATQLELRRDHAAAVDAVHAELDLTRDFDAEFVRRWNLFEVATQARDKQEYLLRPDLGRRLTQNRIEALLRRAGRQRNLASTPAKIRAALTSEQLFARPGVIPAYAESASALLAVLTTMVAQTEVLAGQVGAGFWPAPGR